MAGLPTVELGGATYTLLPIRSLGLRVEIAKLALKSEINAGCAALGLSCPDLGKGCRWDHDVLGYGQRVQDALMEQGILHPEIDRASKTAWLAAIDGVLELAGIVRAEDFTEAPEGA